MVVGPVRVPTVVDPHAERVLGPRWRRARRLLAWSVAMPGLVAALCVVVLGFAAPGWWSAFLLVGVVGPVVGQVVWLRRGVVEPAGWVKVAFLVSGGQALVGVIPCVGVAGGSGVAAGLLLVVPCAGAVSVVTARRAMYALLSPLVPELGDTAFRITVAVRFAIMAPAPISARLVIHADRVEWTARFHRAGSAGPRAGGTVPVAELGQVGATVLTGEPTQLPWLTLPEGTQLYAQPGPALVLGTAGRQWVVPVDDAAVVAELVDRRRTRFVRSGHE